MREAGEVGGADPFLGRAVERLHPRVLRRQPVGYLTCAVGRAVVDDQHAVLRAGSARERLSRGGHDRLDVLGLVVGGQYEPGGAVHEGPVP